jgi:hypothetical protein
VTVVAGMDGCEYHHGSARVRPEGAGCRFEWVADVLPDGLAPAFSDAMDRGVAAVARAFGGDTPHGTVAAGQ